MIQPYDIRIFIRDRPEWNRLLDKEEFSQEQIDQAMKFTVMMFNEMPPETGHTLENFPYKYLLLIGTVYHLLLGGGILRSRNRLSYQTDGVSVDDEAHSEVELALAQQLKQEFLMESKNKKIEANAKAGWGHSSSEYANLGYTHIYFRR